MLLQAVPIMLALAVLATTTAVVLDVRSRSEPDAISQEYLVERGVKRLEQAFVRRARALGGVEPSGRDIDLQRLDGGLEPKFSDYADFLPRAPQGYGWTYGFTTEAQLLSDGFTQPAQGGRYWFCLYPVREHTPPGQTARLRRALATFTAMPLYVNDSGPGGCGRAISSPSSQAPLTATLFVAAPYQASAVTHFTHATAGPGPGNSPKWSGHAGLCVIGTDGLALTGVDASAQVRIVEYVRTRQGGQLERETLNQVNLGADGCASIEKKNLALPRPGKESIERVRFELTGVQYHWPTNPPIHWDGVQPSAEVSAP